MQGMLNYFMQEMSHRVNGILSTENRTPLERLNDVFASQLTSFVQKPAIVSAIFAEGIFNFNKELSATVSEIMKTMHEVIDTIVKEGQEDGSIKFRGAFNFGSHHYGQHAAYDFEMENIRTHFRFN